MKIRLSNIDNIITVNNLQEVTSPRLFSTKMMYDSKGILSTDIFGISKSDRRGTYAYISLKRPFIHPHIYGNILKRMFSEISSIMSGQKKYIINNGELIQDDAGWTGLSGLYEHWDEIDWKKRESSNDRSISLLSKLSKDEAFIDKILVCPPAYRDVMLAGTTDASDHVNEVNELYTKLIRSTALITEGGLFSRILYSHEMKIQETLIEISNYFSSQLSGKHGIIRKHLLGKSVDFGTRSVITAPLYSNNTIHDNMVDIEHTALPLAQACSNFYIFVESWLKNFFTREIINDPNLISFINPETNDITQATIKDAEIQFSDKNITKMINDYIFNPDNRFKIISLDVYVANPNSSKDLIIKKAYMSLTGKIMLENNVTETINRPMTVTDILYIACVDVAERRHVMISRYPVGTDKGLFFNKVRVQSTKSHIKVIFNGKEYPFYPDIDLNIPTDNVGVQFIDSTVFSNSYLDGNGGDYDGDQVSIRGIWSDEANIEAAEIMNKKISALDINGNNTRVVMKEIYNSYYSLTKIGNNPKKIGTIDQNEYLQTTPDGFTLNKITKMLSDTTNLKVGKTARKKSKHNTWDTMTIPANYFYNDHKSTVITLGRFLFNKYVLEGAGVISATGLILTLLDKKGLSEIDKLIGQLYMDDIITRPQFNAYTNRRDTLGYWLNGMLAHTASIRMLKPLKEIEKRKKELYEKYKNEIAAGDIDVMNKVSDELVTYAKELLKDDPGMDLFLSGDLDFNNNYKNNSILKGPVVNKITGQFDFIGTSFMDGIDVKDIPAHANSILSGQYPASIATKDAGYMGKKLLALLQMMEVDEKGSDCGTKNPIPITITNWNKNDMIYSYIVNGNQLIMLDKNNISSYIDKTVLMRSPMSCISTKICNKCAGELFYKLNIKHAGLFATQISHSSLNLALKSKHNSLINLFTINPNAMIEDI